MSQDLLEQKELWNVGAGATTTTIPMVTQSGLSVALSAATQDQLVGSTFDCAIGATRCIAVVNSVSASGVLTLDSPLPSAPEQGTQFVLTPTRDSQLVGSNVIGPTLLATIPYTSFTASSTYYKWLQSTLNRNATRRTIMIVNTMDQPITSPNFYPYDSGPTGQSTSGVNPSVGVATSYANGGIAFVSSEQYSLVGLQIDSFGLGLPMGSTAPTRGQVTIYVSEVLGG